MLNDLINNKKKEWLDSDECTVKSLLQYIKEKNALRDAQIEAIETFLFLKLKGQNKPLSQLFIEGFFNNEEDLSELNINQRAREVFEQSSAARALFEFSRRINSDSNTQFSGLQDYILSNVDHINYNELIEKIFYDVSYTDYLFSLPMGAGKTYLMAAFIYLDLYFAQNEPNNKAFAHNFIILIPSGLKSSIIPSLKTIEKFDPSWVLPEPTASNLKKLIKFEILDQPKTKKKSNRAQNPNAQKVISHQPFEDLMGLIMVVNAEKVILDKLELSDQQQLLEKNEDEKDKEANELRNIIGKIPNLSIHIDEVHHAATDDIKLRQVVNKWSNNGAVNNVIGYSGTPFLSPAEKFEVDQNIVLKSSQITNTVNYYPLTKAIEKFLKKPRVEVAVGLEPLSIIEKGVADFYQQYKDTIYSDGTCAKLAIYCGSIPRLEREVYPFLLGKMNIRPEEILIYHKGNKEYKIPKENELEFNSLDTPLSKKRIILLVQVGKEGWDCRSLTGVILAQKGDSPANMVLQTSCRCLRQVEKENEETAVIWLNEYNATILNKQLKSEQNTTIEEINNLEKQTGNEVVVRTSRREHLRLPQIEYFQLDVKYNTTVVEHDNNTEEKLTKILTDKALLNKAVVISRGLNPDGPEIKNFVESEGSESANFNRWLFQITKESFNSLSRADIIKFEQILIEIFNKITFEKDGQYYFNELYNQSAIRSKIRLAFRIKRELQTEEMIVSSTALMIKEEKLVAVPKSDTLYPNEQEITQILEKDQVGQNNNEIQNQISMLIEQLKSEGKHDLVKALILNSQGNESLAVANKDYTFHYLPYDFSQSRDELETLKEVLKLSEFKTHNLEIYYNGDRQLTDFKIDCYVKYKGLWSYVGVYTPDFLLIQRKDNEIYKVLIIETKGAIFGKDKAFKLRKGFVETQFVIMNNDNYGYQKFDYLYLPDSNDKLENLSLVKTNIRKFFGE